MYALKRKEEHRVNLLPSWQVQAQGWHVQGKGLGGRQGLSQGNISTTSSPAGWKSPYPGFLDEYFVFSQTTSSAGKGSSFSSFPGVFTGHQMLSSKQAKKSPHTPTASKH